MSASVSEIDAPPDAPLVARAVIGDATAFTMLFQRHHPAIHAFAYRLTLCAAAADDIAQDTFVQAARALPSFRGEASFKNWLYTIAANRTRDHHRQHARRARRDEQFAALADEARDHETSSAAHAAVRDALANLTPEQREAIALVYYENLTHAEAARVLGCAEATISWRVFRAKHRLKKLLRAPCSAAYHHA